jgi:multiple sugar transport system ATP-binding protein
VVARRIVTVDVELEGVEKRFAGGTESDARGAALRGVTFQVERGEVLVVVGPSGCGKSTTLRIIAGLEDADAGVVRIGGRSMQGVAPQDRDVAMVFQGYALYPTMTVRENIEFPLKMRRVGAVERRRRADEAASLLSLGRLMDRLPSELSGGERQRVAMGRAIVRRPRVFLFDEPLSNLDAALRNELRVELGVLVRELGVSAIYVTHDQVEAMTLADRICIMNAGSVEQIAPPRKVYEEPATRFTASFIGAPKMNLLEGETHEATVRCGPFQIEPSHGRALPQRVVVGIRPEDVRLVDPSVPGAVPFEVFVAEPLGADTHFVLRSGKMELRARVAGFVPMARGARVHVMLSQARVHLFEAEGRGARLS